MRDLEFIRGSRGSRGFPGNDVAARCSEPPFPTHGGQDDGSYTNSLKICFFFENKYFEAVSVTTVILATVRGEGRLGAAGPYVVSRGSEGSPGEFQKALSCCVLQFLVTLDPSQNRLQGERGSGKPWVSSGGPWESFGRVWGSSGTDLRGSIYQNSRRPPPLHWL